MKEMADTASGFVRNGDIKIVPQSYEDVWFRWLNNIQDWCVSRQLWWGNLTTLENLIN
jgi:valyl-tRNA synthetase